MRHGLVVLMGVLASVAAAEAAEHEVTICMEVAHVHDLPTLTRTTEIAGAIYRDAGTTLRWKLDYREADVNAPGRAQQPNQRTVGVQFAEQAP